MLAMTLNALVHAPITLVEVILLGHLVGAAVSHVEIVADALLLLIPATESMQTRRQV